MQIEKKDFSPRGTGREKRVGGQRWNERERRFRLEKKKRKKKIQI